MIDDSMVCGNWLMMLSRPGFECHTTIDSYLDIVLSSIDWLSYWLIVSTIERYRSTSSNHRHRYIDINIVDRCTLHLLQSIVDHSLPSFQHAVVPTDVTISVVFVSFSSASIWIREAISNTRKWAFEYEKIEFKCEKIEWLYKGIYIKIRMYVQEPEEFVFSK